MPSLIAIALPTGPRFVHELTEAWATGDAVLPVDPRLPLPAAKALLAAMRPAVLVDESGEHQRQPGARPTEPGDALVVATSGTTGDPKGVVLTHDAVRASASATSDALGVDPASDRWLAILPVAHIGGASVITRALLTETKLTFDEDDPEATLVSVVPTQANRLDLARFRKVLVGGSADWKERPANVVRTYGLTETGSGVAYDGTPIEGVDVRVDATGEILVRGPMLLRTYRAGPDPKDADGWFATGDEGHFDEGGLLVVEGRRGDVVVTGGEKVWPQPVEAALLTHPAIADAAICGAPDAEWGQRVVAWIVPADAASPPGLESVRAHVKAVLPAYAAPRELRVVEELPRTGLGKLQRKLLADRC